jgi:NAD(P)-dependent dehydrogenase (short-subunit alcohol dehydrogenase family)
MGEPTLQGQIAVVTGGGRGLGRAVVRALATAGADVALSYHGSRQGALEAADEARRLGRRALVLAADARRPTEVASAVDEAASELGGIDILVNCIGAFERAPVGALTEELMDEAFRVNATAAVLAAQAAARHMKVRGRGAIVNVASLGGLRPYRSHLPYSASKAALVMATQCLALALAPEIRVNGVAPGILDEPGAPADLEGRIPLRRFGRQQEAVDAVMFLLTGASYTTGEVIRLDGGRGLS